MARQTNLSPQEVADMDEAKQRSQRNAGLSLAQIRDRGWTRLKNGSIMAWHVEREIVEGEVRNHVPAGHFLLINDTGENMYDAEEFQKWLRWA